MRPACVAEVADPDVSHTVCSSLSLHTPAMGKHFDIVQAEMTSTSHQRDSQCWTSLWHEQVAAAPAPLQQLQRAPIVASPLQLRLTYHP